MTLLQGKNIQLRPIEPDDLNLLVNWENDPANWEVSGTIAPYSRELMRKYVNNAHLDIYKTGQLRLMIVEKESSATIGTIDIFEFDAFHQRAGLGILIADAQNRGKGLAFEAVNLVRDYCFKHLGIHQLFCNIMADNDVSLHLFKKAGFTINGTQHQWVRSNGSFKDQHFLQLIK